MAVVCPFAAYRPLETAQGEPKMTGHDVWCVHTMVGYLTSTDGYFRSGGWDGTESHWGVGGEWGPDLGGNLDGALFQWQDMLYQADANLDGNPRVLSVETADNAPRSATDLKPWTDKQVDMLVRLGVWVTSREAHANCPATWMCHREGIPRSLIPDTRPGRRGIGYHRQGIDPWRCSSCTHWSATRGKPCPGDARIHQLEHVVIPRIRGGETQEEDMTPAQAETLGNIAERLVRMEKDLTAVKDRAPGYFAKDPAATDGVVYYVDAAHQSKVSMPVGGRLHELLKFFHASGGHEVRAVELGADVLAGIPDAA